MQRRFNAPMTTHHAGKLFDLRGDAADVIGELFRDMVPFLPCTQHHADAFQPRPVFGARQILGHGGNEVVAGFPAAMILVHGSPTPQ